MTDLAPGILLIADPFLKDPNFMRTVVFLAEHETEGSVGFVLNRKSNSTLDEILPDVTVTDIPIYLGGPVQMNTLHYLHRYPNEIRGCKEVMKGVYWGGEFDDVLQLLNTGQIDPQNIRFFLGYSGWSEGQLDTEMSEKTWLTVEAARRILFHPDPEEIWKDSLRLMGGDYLMMINFPLDPQLN